MEFLRFGSSIPGAYWGCCAVCIIQDFKQDPDDKAGIELVCGDGGEPIAELYAGPTYKGIFHQRLRIGTFNSTDMPNHAFLAVLTDWQVESTIGRKWLKLLKEAGFEFIRTVDNSVYTGPDLKNADSEYEDEGYEDSTHANYVFGLFRNIGNGAVCDPFEPPAAWLELEGGVEEASSYLTSENRASLQQSRDTTHLDRWNAGAPPLMKRDDLEAAGVPIWLAGRRSTNPQELAKHREDRQKNEPKPSPAPFGGAKALSF